MAWSRSASLIRATNVKSGSPTGTGSSPCCAISSAISSASSCSSGLSSLACLVPARSAALIFSLSASASNSSSSVVWPVSGTSERIANAITGEYTVTETGEAVLGFDETDTNTHVRIAGQTSLNTIDTIARSTPPRPTSAAPR